MVAKGKMSWRGLLRTLASAWVPLRGDASGARKRARSGNVSVVIGLSLPALATLMFGALDVTNIMSDRSRMRSIADAAALSGARNLAVAMGESASLENARAMAEAMISEWENAPRLNVEVALTNVDGARAIRVVLSAHRDSLFGNLLPPGGWHYSTPATATTVNSMPLCVLAFDDKNNKNLSIGGAAQILAPECLVHSNGDLETRNSGRIEAGQTQAVRSAAGNITPAPISDAPVIPDPFEDRAQPEFDACKGKLAKVVIAAFTTGKQTLPAGSHCGVILVGGDAELVLEPGDHYFQAGAVQVRENARLTGRDVALIFDGLSFFDFTGSAQVSITGRETGPNAGFVVIATRDNKKKFAIDSTHVERLDGVIYIPAAELVVGGQSDVARQSDWTVVVAQRLEMSGNPRLYLNSDYNDSPIEVPGGVGPRGGARLVE
jgi:hypothetical protein